MYAFAMGVHQRADTGALCGSLCELHQLFKDMPYYEQMRSALDYLIDEGGLLMQLTLVLTRLLNNAALSEPLLAACLAVIEDVSCFEEREEQALLDANCVARVANVLQLTVGDLMNGGGGPPDRLFGLLMQCLTILSNLSQQKSDLRHEILQHRVLDALAPLLA
jgi:hypothetical protein